MLVRYPVEDRIHCILNNQRATHGPQRVGNNALESLSRNQHRQYTCQVGSFGLLSAS